LYSSKPQLAAAAATLGSSGDAKVTIVADKASHHFIVFTALLFFVCFVFAIVCFYFFFKWAEVAKPGPISNSIVPLQTQFSRESTEILAAWSLQ
jgi:hypothetical protein